MSCALFDLVVGKEWAIAASLIRSATILDLMALQPETGLTLLHMLIVPSVDGNLDDVERQSVAKLMATLLERCADPLIEAPRTCKSKLKMQLTHQEVSESGHLLYHDVDDFDDYGTECKWATHTVSIECRGRSALACAVALRTECHKSSSLASTMEGQDFATTAQHQTANDLYPVWRSTAKRLDALIARLADPVHRLASSCGPDAQQLLVHESVVFLWEKFLLSSPTHDVVLQCEDGIQVTAHAQLLSCASPVLSAMLSSNMLEGSQQRVQLPDCPRAAASLFLELLYTGTTNAEVDSSVALSVLTLAHRWQIPSVVSMMERALAGLLTEENFPEVASAASHRDLPTLKRACITFAAGSPCIQRRFEEEDLPREVLLLLDGRERVNESAPVKKMRRSF
mmetsp:Transcript_51691/g.85738  ORF Transcript_51691/g.85738 Transcript_51691/m.85738 type:complete len:398 (-) Transcript_51691:124-1317(-)|eukprot:CAMPEP_0119311914 /NCGR_PEP_ID=MMETSP1333-20130426/24444_1 /TAXON_ID=418940 /ORGANISM="Scyphosphaera apsteinii, Strain RCC1455" /LENGTH=397 /DNA_ID=CAMNT_0007316421 /DNA_START=116 /DNA_END=1309 /DNA_ORIENTATION=+